MKYLSEAINGEKKVEYEKDFMKIKFNLHNDLPLNNMLKFHLATVIVRSVFEEDASYYPQVFLDEYFSVV